MLIRRKRTAKILVFFLAACLLFSGCGKDKDQSPTAEYPIELPEGMEFEPTAQIVTAKQETNLRNYPSQGPESTVLFILKNGEYADRVGYSESGWSQLEYEGKTCYAVSSYLTTDLDYVPTTAPAMETEEGIQTEFTPVQQTVTAKDAVNLRSIPSVTSADSEIITQLKNGDTVECIGVSDNGWSKLIYQGQTCYAVTNYLTTDLNYTPPTETTPAYMEEDGIETVFEEASGSVTAKDTVNLRSLPSVTNPDAVVLDQLHKGELAERLGTSQSGWTKLTYKGKTCYAVTSYLTTDLDNSETSETGSNTGTDGDTIKTQFADVNEKVTAKDAVNLRTLPSVTDANSQVIKKLMNGEIVTRTGINEDLGWSRVEFEGQILYCVSNYIKLADAQ